MEPLTSSISSHEAHWGGLSIEQLRYAIVETAGKCFGHVYSRQGSVDNPHIYFDPTTIEVCYTSLNFRVRPKQPYAGLYDIRFSWVADYISENPIPFETQSEFPATLRYASPLSRSINLERKIKELIEHNEVLKAENNALHAQLVQLEKRQVIYDTFIPFVESPKELELAIQVFKQSKGPDLRDWMRDVFQHIRERGRMLRNEAIRELMRL